MSENHLNNPNIIDEKFKHYALLLCVIIILTNSVGMLFPCLNSMFSPYYGSIAKHIALTNNWSDLVFHNHDWLDKPHFPFWATALSFKIFGINSFAYILPGFIFHIIGIVYTYKIAKLFYNEKVGILAALFTASSLHLMLSAIDVRAEAFLIGQITPACYYWLKYHHKFKIKYLLLGAVFTALAMMTKGLFTLITIISGLACLWIYQKKWISFIHPKWLIALLLSLVFVAPELVALYLQFDSQPNKVVFGTTHVSGIKWFFWGSQFGRFFNTGQIAVNHTQDARYLFFVYTFFWAYLPWWPAFIAALFARKNKVTSTQANTAGSSIKPEIKKYNQKRAIDSNTMNKMFNQKEANVFLFGSFFITFILFSVTKFQIDHYTNILFPFASIIGANWLYSAIKNKAHSFNLVYKIELGITFLLIVLTSVLSFLVLSGTALTIMIVVHLICYIGIFKIYRKQKPLKMLTYPIIAIGLTFVFAMLVNGMGYVKYDAGYQIAQYLNQKHNIQIVGYNIDLNSLDFNSNNPFTLINETPILQKNKKAQQLEYSQLEKTTNKLTSSLHQSVYCVTTPKYQTHVLSMFPQAHVVNTISGTRIETYMRNVIHPKKLQQKLDKYVIIQLK